MIEETELRDCIIEAAKKQRWNAVEPRNWFHCSGAGTCRRQLWNAKNGKSEFSNKSIMAMNVGTMIHSWLENNVEFNKAVSKEVQVAKHYEDIVVVGKADMYDEDTVYDYKTIRALWYLPKVDQSSKSSPKTYYYHHVPQLNMYADILGKDNISIVYVDKGNMDIKQFNLKADKSIVEDVVKKFHEVYNRLDESENPFDYCGCFGCNEEKKRSKKAADKDGWKRDTGK